MLRRLPLFILVACWAARLCAESSEITLESIDVVGNRIEPVAQAATAADSAKIQQSDALNLKTILDTVPGVSVKPGNGPRDVGISIRGSGAKVGFGVKNVKLYEDGFPLTQADGLGRTDILDPNAHERIEVVRGPSSTLYGNYALDGIVNFHTHRGENIRGLTIGSAAGSFGYWNEYLLAGDKLENLDYSLFASGIGSNGYIDHSGFHTFTQDFTGRIKFDSERNLTLKFINNDLDANVPNRLTLDQLNANPRSAGNTFVTGVGSVSAEQADQNRKDRRTYIGARYNQQLTSETGLSVLSEYDTRYIHQTFGTVFDGIYPNFFQSADVNHNGMVFGVPSKEVAGIFFNFMDQDAPEYRNLADYNGTRGALNSLTRGYTRNAGAKFQHTMYFSSRWTGIAGSGVEASRISADVQTRTAAETYSRVRVDRRFWNVAPELAAIYRPSPDVSIHGRIGTGYGNPGIGQLTTTPAGISGNNTDLKAQRNVGFELGTSGNVSKQLAFDVAAYYEFFYNELVTQSPGSGLSSFTSNAPRADHRGMELALNWKPGLGFFWSNAYTFNDHIYKDFMETIGSGLTLDRSGKRIPGVERHRVNSRLGYEAENRWGAWIEMDAVASYYINNSNTLRAPSATVFNVNTHCAPRFARGIKGLTLFLDVRNVFNRTYVGSANVVSDLPTDNPSTLTSTKAAFFAGDGRSISGGAKVAF